MNPDPTPTAAMARVAMRKWTILFTSAVAWLAPSAIGPGLPALYADYAHLPEAELLSRLVLTMPMLSIALSGPLVGYAVDRLGRRRVLITSIACFGVVGMSGLVLQSLVAIIVSRALLGVFLAGILTSITALLGDYYDGEERRRMAGLQATFMSFGTVVFVVLGGLLAEIHWRLGFLIFAYVFLVLPGIVLSCYEPRQSRPPGSAAQTAASFSRGSLPIILALYLLAFVCMIGLFMIPSQTQFFLREIGIPDPTLAGIAVGIFNLSAGIASFAFAWLHRRIGSNAVFAVMFTVVGLGYVLVGRSDTYAGIAAAMAFGGLSMGVFLPNLNLAVLSRVSESVRGRALSGITTALYLGQFLSPFYSVPIGIAFGIGFAFEVTGYWLFAIGALFAGLAIARLGRR
jgi:MFS family permease